MESQNIVADRENVIVCPFCGQHNETDATRCIQCWSRLNEVEAVTKEEGIEITRKHLALKKRKRLIRIGVAAIVILGLVGWFAYRNIGTTRFLPPATTTISAAAAPGNWAMFQRDFTHSGSVSGDVALPQGNLKWNFQTDDPIFSSPSVVDGRVYFTTGDRRVIALDGQSGDLIWERKTTGPVNSTPAIAGDYVFYGLRDGRMVSLDRDTGELLWDFKTDNFVFSSPTIHHGVAYLGSGDGKLYAFDAKTGEIRWTYRARRPIVTSPAVNGEVIAVVSQGGKLHIVDINTGKLRLDYRLTAVTNGSPAFKGDYVYTLDESGTVRAVDWRKKTLPFEKTARWIRTQLFVWGMVNTLPPQKGLVWATRTGRGERFSNTPAISGEMIYAGSFAGNLYALDLAIGDVIWTFRADASIIASPSVAGQTVYIGDKDGRVYAVDALTGEQQWTFQADGRIDASPAIANGMLYVTSWDGNLYAIE